MTDNGIKERLINARPIILWAELGGLLHDIGKLSDEFYEYRQNWRSKDNGWDIDPHDHDFISNNDKILFRFSELKQLFDNKLSKTISNLNILYPDFVDSSLKDQIDKHTHPDPSDLLTNLLKAADSKDAAIERNNPLFSADQTDFKSLYDADVFGYEKPWELNNGDNNGLREALYFELGQDNLISEYLNKFSCQLRQHILEIFRYYFQSAFSDTTRPDNDISLWEHSYSVASIYRVLVAHHVIYDQKLDSFDKVRFGILGTGWDSLSFLSQGEKIGDILGRQEILDRVKQYITDLIEFEYPLGNLVYEDNDGVYFLVPEIADYDFSDKITFKVNQYRDIITGIKQQIEEYVLSQTQGDLTPQFHMVKSTRFVTHITRCIQELKKKTAFPVNNMDDNFKSTLKDIWDKPENQMKDVCPVCLRRPVIKEQPGQRGICRECLDRRARSYSPQNSIDTIQKNENEKGTAFIGEIVKANSGKDGQLRRASLVVAKFHLDHWLDGTMIRSLFVKEAHGLEKELKDLGNTTCFHSSEMQARQNLENSPSGNLISKGYDYDRIRREVMQCYDYKDVSEEQKKEAINTVYLYDQHIKKNILNNKPGDTRENWDKWLINARDEYSDINNKETLLLLPDILCAKTPTPSTILDVWETTKEFLNSFNNAAHFNQSLFDNKRFSRARVIFAPDKENLEDKEKNIFPGAAYSGHIKFEDDKPKQDIDLVWIKDNGRNYALIIGIDYPDFARNNWENADLLIEDRAVNSGTAVNIGKITEIQEHSYLPARIIATTPDMLLAIVPADKALTLSRQIYQQYQEQFGKAMGRLPLSIGNIYFEEHTPMYAVLDSAKRMIANFDQLEEVPLEMRVSDNHKTWAGNEKAVITLDQVTWPDGQSMGRTFEWRLPYRLGDGKIDYFHPYFIAKTGEEENKRYSSRKSYFKTVVGDVVHFSEVQPGDTLKIYPNYYDFEFLESTGRRYDVSLGTGYRRRSVRAGILSRPYLLDDILPVHDCSSEEYCLLPRETLGLQTLWERMREKGERALMPQVTDTQLRNIESLWINKLEEWEVGIADHDSKGYQQWTVLVETTLKKEFPSKYGDMKYEENQRDFAYLKEAVISGLFFDCLELHFRILKEKINL
jgi:CRISPR-associated Csx11 family protein